MADSELDESHHVGQHLRSILSLCQEKQSNCVGICTGLVRVYSGKARGNGQSEIRGGEGGLEIGCNS